MKNRKYNNNHNHNHNNNHLNIFVKTKNNKSIIFCNKLCQIILNYIKL
jgi:hypothetical protein